MKTSKFWSMFLCALFTTFYYSPVNASKNINWTPAGQLSQGDILKTSNGKIISVVSIKKKIGTQPMYNLTINQNHDFFISHLNQGVLAHNCNDSDDEDLDKTGLYRLKFSNLKKPYFQPKIASKLDDARLYTFRVTPELTPKEIETLQSWSEKIKRYEPFPLPYSAADCAATLLDDYNKYSGRIFYSIVYREDKLLGVSQFRIDSYERAVKILQTTSDPENLVDKNGIRGFGSQLKYKGILYVQNLHANFDITSSASTIPSGKINLQLGFTPE